MPPTYAPLSSPQRLRLAAERYPSPQRLRLAAERYPSPQRLRLAAERYPSPQRLRLAAERYPSPQRLRLAAERYSSPRRLRLAAERYPSPIPSCFSAALRQPGRAEPVTGAKKETRMESTSKRCKEVMPVRRAAGSLGSG